jgi:hypothetical protein
MRNGSYVRLKRNGEIINRPSREYLDNIDINEYMSCVIDHKNIIHENYSLLNDYYFEGIPDSVISDFKYNPTANYIFENLNTHDADKLIASLRKKYSDFEIHDVLDHAGDHRYLVLDIIGDNFYPLYNSNDFDNIISFYGYSKSKVDCVRDRCRIELEPIYADRDEANDIVYNKCNGIIYHITNEEGYKKIMKNGFRINGVDTDYKVARRPKYRDYPNRTYFVAIPGNVKNIIHSSAMEMAIMNYFKGDLYHDKIYILKVRVSGMNIDFYRDSVSISIDGSESPAVYCYCNIPPQFIELIYDKTFDELNPFG